MKSKTNRSAIQPPPWRRLLASGQQAWSELLGEPLASLTSVVVIAITLVLPLTLVTAASELESTLKQYSRSPQLIAYLRLNSSESMISDVSERLLMRDEISSIELVPKALALTQFSEASGLGDLIGELGSNPLPDALLITPLAADISSLEALTNSLNQDPDIDSAELDSQWLIRLQGLINVIKQLATLIGALAVLAFFLVIGTTVRALIQASIDDIRIQKLVGATDFYVIKPLIFKGIYYGFGGASLAVLLQFSVFALFNSTLADFLNLYSDVTGASSDVLTLSWLVSVTALSASCGIGAIAAYLFAKQQILTLNPG